VPHPCRALCGKGGRPQNPTTAPRVLPIRSASAGSATVGGSMGLQAHECRPENNAALATGLSIMLPRCGRVPHPSLFSSEGWVPTNLDHRIASTILSSGRRRECLGSRFWGLGNHNSSPALAQDYAPPAHNEDSETHEQNRCWSGSCVRVPRIDHRDLPGLHLPPVTI
jgi:hypothetical protein